MTSEPRMPIGMSRLRIARLLRRRRHRVEADIGEEDDARAAHDAAPPNSPNVPVFGGMKDVVRAG